MASDKINIVTEDAEPTRRQRILRAAMGLFVARGYAGTSTLAIASAARVSKRDLYAEFAGKREILAACVQSRSLAMTARLDAPVPFDRAGLASVLIAYGTGVRMGMQEPEVIATYRLVLHEVPRDMEAARVLDAEGRAAGLDAMVGLLRAGQVAGLLGGEAAERMAGQYFSLLMGDVILQHLLGLAPRESEAEARGRAEFATRAMLRLNVPGGAI